MQNWFHSEELEVTIDLNAIVAISWNCQYGSAQKARFFTKIQTAKACANGTSEVAPGYLSLYGDSDRQKLHSRLFADSGLPIILRLSTEADGVNPNG